MRRPPPSSIVSCHVLSLQPHRSSIASDTSRCSGPSAAPPPGHDPDVSTAAWVRDVLPTLPPHRRPRHDCVLGPGEVLYFPPSWWHATLNEDAHTVFVSSFASDQARDDEGPAFLGA